METILIEFVPGKPEPAKYVNGRFVQMSESEKRAAKMAESVKIHEVKKARPKPLTIVEREKRLQERDRKVQAIVDDALGRSKPAENETYNRLAKQYGLNY